MIYIVLRIGLYAVNALCPTVTADTQKRLPVLEIVQEVRQNKPRFLVQRPKKRPQRIAPKGSLWYCRDVARNALYCRDVARNVSTPIQSWPVVLS